MYTTVVGSLKKIIGLMKNDALDRKIAVILAADIVDYSTKMETDEGAAIQALNEVRGLADPYISQFKGRIFHTAGDSIMAEFNSPTDAVTCAAEIQKKLIERNKNVDEAAQMSLRIGINMGDVIEQQDNLFGEGVNIAARLEAKAPSDGILISKNIYEFVHSRTPYSFADLGEQKVKKTVFHAYQVDFGHGHTQLEKAGHNSNAKILMLCLAFVFVMLFGFGAYTFLSNQQDFTPLDKDNLAFEIPDTPSITVAPFTNLVPSEDTAYLKKSILDNIVSVLNGSPELFVVSSEGVKFRQKEEPEIRQIAEAVGVRYVLNGSYQVIGNDIRITAQLNDALNGKVLWNGKFDSSLNRLFSILDDISNTVFEEVHIEVTGKNRSDLAFFENNEDYLAYLKCYDLFNYYTPDKNRQSENCIARLSEAAQAAPPAKLLLGYVYWQKVFIGISTDAASDIAFARTIANNVQKEMNTGDPIILHGWLDFMEGKYESVSANALQAIEADPSNSFLVSVAGSLLRRVAKYEEAKNAFAQSMRMNPHPELFVPTEYSFTLAALGEYDEAIRVLERTLPSLTREGQSGLVLTLLLVVHGLNGDETLARETCARAKSENANFNLERQLFLQSGTIDKAFLARFSDAARKACE